MKIIPLTQGQVAIVDDEDYERLSIYQWYALLKGNKWYARRSCGKRGPKQYLHHEVMGIHQTFDHKNGNGLDNRKENLRLASDSQNGANRGPNRNNTSGFKGVFWHAAAQKWMVQLKHKGKFIYLGLFEEKEKAARAYDAAARKYFGEFACPNFP